MSLIATPNTQVENPEAAAGPDLRTVRQHGASETPARKILLLEDDPSFKEIIKDFLTDSGFTVVAVQNGVEGVHEVMGNDFEVILTDMMMPTLPGDMFYRAVERMRPHLCERFVFMTGHRGNGKVNDFITTVNGTILTKPFHVDDLLEMIAFVRVRTHLFVG
jgi:DNA-binding response OmpR family regulator